MKQERAQQTHQALLRAAAVEFDQHGYTGTSLARISQAAGVTMGALTFHFASKAALADAVRAEAAALTRAALAGVAEGEAHAAAGLTDLLTRLLQEEPGVRAAARLSWEQPEAAGNWYTSWLPTLRSALTRGQQASGAEHGLGARELEVLAYCLVTGAESVRRGVVTPSGATPERGEEIRQDLQRIWQRALAGPADRN